MHTPNRSVDNRGRLVQESRSCGGKAHTCAYVRNGAVVIILIRLNPGHAETCLPRLAHVPGGSWIGAITTEQVSTSSSIDQE